MVQENLRSISKLKPELLPRPDPTNTKYFTNKRIKQKKNRLVEWVDANFGQSEDAELRLVIVGQTKSGKSATGNSILGSRIFDSRPTAASVTRQCQLGTSKLGKRNICVLDTPSLYDTLSSEPKEIDEVIKMIKMSLPGPHAFLLVLKPHTFTEQIKTFDYLFKVFGDDFRKYVIVTFTGLDELKHHSISIEQYIAESKDDRLKGLIKQCENRLIAFDNHSTAEMKKGTTESLVNMIDNMIEINGKYFTNKMYQETEAYIKNKAKQAAEKKDDEERKVIAEIESEFQQQTKDIQREIHDLQSENRRTRKELQLNKIQLMKERIGEDAKRIENRQDLLQNDLERLKPIYEKTVLSYIRRQTQKQKEIDQCKERYLDECKLQLQEMIGSDEKIDSLAVVSTEKKEHSWKHKMKYARRTTYFWIFCFIFVHCVLNTV